MDKKTGEEEWWIIKKNGILQTFYFILNRNLLDFCFDSCILRVYVLV